MRRLSVVVVVLLVVSCLVAGCRAGGDYPNKTVEIVVPWTAGGVSDLTVRALASEMEEVLGQPVMVSNKPGASGLTGIQHVVDSKPDGYVIGWVGGRNLAPELYQSSPPYNTSQYVPISQVSVGVPVMVALTKAEFDTVEEFVDYVKGQEEVLYAHSGRGNGPHMTGVQLASTYDLAMSDVPYSGDSESLTALLREEVVVAFMNLASAIAQAEAGNIKILAVLNYDRISVIPDTPTFDETDYPINKGVLVVNGFCAPAETPEAVVAKVEDAVEKGMQKTSFTEAMDELGVVVVYRGAEEFAEIIDNFKSIVGPIIKDSGVFK